MDALLSLCQQGNKTLVTLNALDAQEGRDADKARKESAMTNITTFAETVKSEMSRMLAGYDITEQAIVKMNDLKLHGLIARRKGEDTGATVYIDSAFEDYLNGESIKNIVTPMVNTIINAEYHKPVCTDINLSFDSIRDKLSLRLIDRERNKEYLRDKPFREIGAGLAVVAEIQMGDDYSIVVTDSIAEDFDKIELFDTALKNMQTRHPARMQSLEGAIFGEDRNILDGEDEPIDGMYTLMIEGMQCFGASVLAYEGIGERIRRMYGGSFFILPSSLHEVILLKAGAGVSADDLKAMVVQANRTVVDPADVLSDNVFYFDGEIHRVA